MLGGIVTAALFPETSKANKSYESKSQQGDGQSKVKTEDRDSQWWNKDGEPGLLDHLAVLPFCQTALDSGDKEQMANAFAVADLALNAFDWEVTWGWSDEDKKSLGADLDKIAEAKQSLWDALREGRPDPWDNENEIYEETGYREENED